MKVLKRVKNSDNQTVGFITDSNEFYTVEFIKQNIAGFSNITLDNNGTVKGKSRLPIVYYSTLQKERYVKEVKKNNFERDIQKDLEYWRKHNSDIILQLDGSRQIGKTTELTKFAYKNYEYVVYINLVQDNNLFYDTVLKNSVNLYSMNQYCTLRGLPPFHNSSKTILIIDEVQYNSLVYNKLRELRNVLNCHIIITGSYLGRLLKSKYFKPMGTVEILTMFNLSFSEFLKVFNKIELLNKLNLYGKSNDKEYEELFNYYNIYRQIGGYPAVIKEYLKTKNIASCMNIISRLLDVFDIELNEDDNDIKDRELQNYIYKEAILRMLQNKKGSGKDLIEDVTNDIKRNSNMIVSKSDVNRAIKLLIYSKIIGTSSLCANGDIVNLHANRRLYYLDGDIVNLHANRRLYYLDCGIVNYLTSTNFIIDSDKEGLITETFVFCELYRLFFSKFSDMKVKGATPSFAIYNEYELDFLIIGMDNTVYGIEAKTKTGTVKSLKVFIDKKIIDKGIVAKASKGGINEQYMTIPIFAVGYRFPYN